MHPTKFFEPKSCPGYARSGYFNVFIFLFPVLVYLVSPPLLCKAQESCVAMNCTDGKFKIEILPVYSDVLNTCNGNAAAGCGNIDQFRQISYQVRLRYTTNDQSLSSGFYLNYKHLRITTKLHIYQPTSGGFSYIDTTTTINCFDGTKSANNWGGSVVEQVQEVNNETQVAVDFDNPTVSDPCGLIYPCSGQYNGTCGNPIHFVSSGYSPVQNAPSCAFGNICLYADLFKVTVNAYPSEHFAVEVATGGQNFTYYQPVSGGECVPPSATSPQVSISSLSAPSQSDINSKIQLSLDAPASSNSFSGCDIPLNVTFNSANSNDLVYIDNAEFVIKVSRTTSEPEIISGVNSIYYQKTVSGNDAYYHFIFPVGSISNLKPNTPITLATFTVKPSIPNNLNWSTTVSLINNSQTRLMTFNPNNTSLDCSTFPFSTSNSQTCSYSGIDPCAQNVPYQFFIQNVTPIPGNGHIKVGLKTTTLSSITLEKFAFDLNFVLDPAISIDYIDTHSFCNNGNFGVFCPNFYTSSNASGCNYVPTGGRSIQFCIGEFGTGNKPTIPFVNGEAFMDIYFHGPGCIKDVIVTRLDIRREGDAECIPSILNDISPATPACAAAFWGTILFEANHSKGVEAVALELDQASCPLSDCNNAASATLHTTTDNNGIYNFNTCTTCSNYAIIPTKDDNPLNGVTTYDLVLISKHILGIQPLSSPYKMIAADANKSGSITTFDVVEFRKLILGIYTMLPNNTSWRFVTKAYVFPNPQNPFVSPFDESWIYSGHNPPNEIDFIGIKVGDVNGTAIVNSNPNKPGKLDPTSIIMSPMPGAKSDQFITIPITYTGNVPLEAIQLGIKFNPLKYTLISPSQGDLPNFNDDNFGLIKLAQGEIRALWFPTGSDPFHQIKQGDVLFYLTFKKLTSGFENDLLSLDDNIMESLAWDSSDAEYSVIANPVSYERSATATLDTPLQVICQPNPTNGAVTLAVQSNQSGKGRIALFGPFGVRYLSKDVEIGEGSQVFDLPEVAQLPAGVYVWKVYAFDTKLQGRLVKQ
jgi:hypothetical protein